MERRESGPKNSRGMIRSSYGELLTFRLTDIGRTSCTPSRSYMRTTVSNVDASPKKLFVSAGDKS